MDLSTSVVTTLDAVSSTEWNSLCDPNNPFVRHEFLYTLERSGSVGNGTGWEPRYVLVRQNGRLVAAAPAYLRSDSFGEYIFDFQWAEAAARARIPYYPKMTVAIPFTPATGPRLLSYGQADGTALRVQLIRALLDLQQDAKAHSIHVLFANDEEVSELEKFGFARRASHQFHFRNPGYGSYESFLAALRSEARKQLRKERRHISEAAVSIECKQGMTLNVSDWRDIEQFYLHTAGRKWGRPYLTSEFFRLAASALSASALVFFASVGGERIGMSLSFVAGRHIYGRYYGATQELSGLHFELCYHRLIDFAVRHNMVLVEAGAQGEHKVKRGFQPVITHSAHWFAHPGLGAAISTYLLDEQHETERQIELAQIHTPYRMDALPPFPLRAGVPLKDC